MDWGKGGVLVYTGRSVCLHRKELSTQNGGVHTGSVCGKCLQGSLRLVRWLHQGKRPGIAFTDKMLDKVQ